MGWTAMAVIVLAALAGAFGGGRWSSVAVTGADSVVARYSRLGRAHSPLALRVEWTPLDGDATVWLDRAYLDGFAVEEVLPPPAAVTLHPQRVYYSFRVNAPADRVAVELRLKAKHGGHLVGAIGIGDQPAVVVSHWLFP